MHIYALLVERMCRRLHTCTCQKEPYIFGKRPITAPWTYGKTCIQIYMHVSVEQIHRQLHTSTTAHTHMSKRALQFWKQTREIARYTYTCIYTYIYIYVRICIYTSIERIRRRLRTSTTAHTYMFKRAVHVWKETQERALYKYICVYIHIYIHTHTYIHIHTYMYIYTYIYTYTYTCIYAYTYIYIYICWSSGYVDE